MSENNPNNPTYDINDAWWDRAGSDYESEEMSEEAVENALARLTPNKLPLKKLSMVESVKNRLGFHVPRRTDPIALMRARRMIKASRSREQRSDENARDQMIQSFNDKEQTEADKRRAMEIMDYDKKQKLARAAAIARAKAGPRVPITQQMINAARSGVNKLWISRVRGHTSPSDYLTRAFEHDVATDDLERLEKRFYKQEQENPGAHQLKPLPYPSNYPADNQAFPFANSKPNPNPKGGKSKRVKSKRVKSKRVKSKRRTQRRNTRK